MICKQCGAEMPQSATKCRRCGNKVPPKSDCGGFYELASAGTRMWEDSKPAAPAPVYIRETAPTPPPNKTPFILMSVLAGVLAFCLLLTLVLNGIGGKKGSISAPVSTPNSENVTPDNETPGEPWQPSFDATSVYMQYSGDNFSISYNAEKLIYPFVPKLDFQWQWRWATADDFAGLGEDFVVPTEEELANFVVLDFTLNVDEEMFGAVKESDDNQNNPEYIWDENQGRFWSWFEGRNIVYNGNKLICNIDAVDLTDVFFSVEIVRQDTNGGALTIAIQNIPFEMPAIAEPEPEPEQEGDDQQEGGAQQEKPEEGGSFGNEVSQPSDEKPTETEPETPVETPAPPSVDNNIKPA